MDFKYFSRNGTVLPIAEAAVPLSNIEFQYGFGVYESIRLGNGIVYFVADHLERLMESAATIGLAHPYSAPFVETAIAELVQKNGATTCNIKVLLVGGRSPEDASLFILCLNPLFPDKKLYTEGATLTTYEYERAFPHAKTLNMLESYLAYKKALEAGAYDALLIDRKGRITEGTRTNFFCTRDTTLVGPHERDILLGVARKGVLKVAEEAGFTVVQKDTRPGELAHFDGAFVTSTSAKLMPVRSIDAHVFGAPTPAQARLMAAFDGFPSECKGKMD